MTFIEGLTFLTNDNDCWVMLTRVSEGSIEVYCECIVDDAADNMNSVQNMNDAADGNMTVEFITGADPLAPL